MPSPASRFLLGNYLQLRLTHAVNYTEAADLCRKLLKLRPEEATLLDAYAVCLSRLDAPAAEVERYYRASIKTSPTYLMRLQTWLNICGSSDAMQKPWSFLANA
jgi:hypothetical protein